MKQLLLTLWVLPAALPVYLLYLWPATALGLLDRMATFDDGALLLHVKHPAWAARWWSALWVRMDLKRKQREQTSTESPFVNWVGHALPAAVVIDVGDWPVGDPAYWDAVHHEHEHVRQWFTFGPLFPVVYGALWLWHSARLRSFYLGYKANPLEVAATDAERGSAGTTEP